LQTERKDLVKAIFVFSGKTTFMNTLCGRATYGRVTGTVRINHKESAILVNKTMLNDVGVHVQIVL